MKKNTFVTIFNQSYLESIYKKFKKDKNSISSHWRNFFLKKFKKKKTKKKTNIKIKKKYIINFFRKYGYKIAKLNPLNISKKKNIIKFNKIKKKYLLKKKNKKYKIIKKIFNKYKKIYSKKIGFEFTYLNNKKEKKWIQNKIENIDDKKKITNKKKIYILKNLIYAESFEKYLGLKYPGSKRFSLEGAESFILILKNIINYSKKKNKKKIIIGMAHRGRLNVLINILKKNILKLFCEFSNLYIKKDNSGDVKYHKGCIRITKNNNNKKMIINLQHNPSHLEIINPVVMGVSRAYSDIYNKKNIIVPINVHGDASISGQGVIQETLNMSKTKAYNVNGTIHIIINNQIGFTTSNNYDLRSSKSCADIAKMINIPIFHVNSDCPESVMFITKIAFKFREKFKKDVFINLYCYRRQGHNEIDDPFITQPILYKKILKHPKITKIYKKKLINKKIINKKYFKKIKKKYFLKINNKFIFFENNKKKILKKKKKKIIKKNNINDFIIKKKILKKIIYKINNIPKNINMHSTVKKIYNYRKNIKKKNHLLDWGTAENLTYATILFQGISCRLSGEDIERGTFSHRHCVIHDQKNKKYYIPLKNISKNQGNFNIWNSTLSEESILAFEYGYANTYKNKNLTIWEAQFGDFCNGAQIVIDQFISASEQKWNENCNLVLFLPHGYEGQGPEHSSGRIERFLQLCAEKNIIICIPSTPVQLYHLLRRQIFKNILKPLIIFSPKSLLRHPLAKSSLKEFYSKKFLKILPELDNINNNNDSKRIVFCSGKIYYELLIKRRKIKKNNIILLRIEQLYPFPKKYIINILKKYKKIKDIIWCQEEPKNQGAWNYIKNILKKKIIKKKIKYIGRKKSSSTAVGNIIIHKKQQKKIINKTLNIK
ncbi:2-oxoglutarate dehydrogenase E1 component [Buchnera aphidicola]|uniref:2-oxoglutarate dehydrogenase E1 component n=1 Tax=Buchnera aphidicola TaxID=9 RepID=UPI0031B86280